MSERADEGRAPDDESAPSDVPSDAPGDVYDDERDALSNDTIPETPSHEPAAAAANESSNESAPPAASSTGRPVPAAEEATAGAAASEAHETSAADDDGEAPAALEERAPTSPPAALVVEETPERAGRRVSQAGWRVGTRVTLGLAFASVLPSAAVLAAVSFPEEAASLGVSVGQVAFGAFALSLGLSLFVGLRVRAELSPALASLEGRLRLLASGQKSARYSGKQPAELSALDDAADLLCETLGALGEREEAERARTERLFTLAEHADAIARGQLSQRLPSSDDVAEATLAASVNRLVDALERQVVRLKSHARLLASGSDSKRPAFDEGEDDPVALIEKRVHGLRPIPPLLNDISTRLLALSRMPRGEARVPDDLARLSEAIAQRARAAQALFESLEANLPRLPRAPGSEARGLTGDQERALAALVSDLEELTVDTSLPRLVESLSDLDASDVASRLARAKVGA